MIVTDAGPLIALGRIGRLKLLKNLFGVVVVPQGVLAECLLRPDLPGAGEIRQARREGVLDRRIAHFDKLPPELPAELGVGESETLALAKRLHCPALIDDKRARRLARSMGNRVVGTGAVLIKAKQQGLIPEIGPLLDQLRDCGYRLSEAFVSRLLEIAGESR